MTSHSAQLQWITNELIEDHSIRLAVLREDLVHPITGGNKWRKLKYNFQQAKEKKFENILTFGGAYSNHLVATAVAANQAGFKTIGLVRGEESFPLNKTLQTAAFHGMKFHYISREEFRKYRDENENTRDELQSKFGRCFIIPEGGSNLQGVMGCREILNEKHADFDMVCAATGTGATLAGLIASLKSHQQALGFCVLNNSGQLKVSINNRLAELNINHKDWKLNTDYDFGGYAKSNNDLRSFVFKFNNQFNIPVEPIYTGKMFYGIFDLIAKNYFPTGSRILALHSGGLQYL